MKSCKNEKHRLNAILFYYMFVVFFLKFACTVITKHFGMSSIADEHNSTLNTNNYFNEYLTFSEYFFLLFFSSNFKWKFLFKAHNIEIDIAFKCFSPFFSKKKNEWICFGNPLICEYEINATFVVFYCYSLITVPHDDFHLYIGAIFIGT